MGLHLVTGGNGFVGSFIARALVGRGERVRAIDVGDRSSFGPDVEYLRVDVTDTVALKAAMKGVDHVHHNAALVPLKKAGDLFWRVNVEGTRNVLNVAKECGVKHISHMSSSAIFGSIDKQDCPITHTTRLQPVEAYGRSKLAGEEIIRDHMARSEMPSCSVIRPRTIIGTERLGIFQILFEWISEGRNVYIIGDGSNRFQFAHVDDLADVSIETALRRKSGIFNVGTDRFGTLREVLERLCRHAGTGSKVIGIPTWLAIPPLWLADKLRLSPLAPWHYLTYHKPFYYDLTAEFSALQWRPKYSNDEMIVGSYDWYMANRLRLKSADELSAHRGAIRQGILSMIKKLS
jgi:nucleoside-diphosphate-sugar epimerase